MLVHLSVHNYAIVEHLDLELDRGMSVITGETGAGKSIMLDALGLTLGDRADNGVVRPGAEKPTFWPPSICRTFLKRGPGWPNATLSAMVRASCAASSLPKADRAATSMARHAPKATSRLWASC